MAKIKLLISGLPVMGKTTLLSVLTDTLIVARDGKKYPFPQAHINIPDFTKASDFTDLIYQAVESYETKHKTIPKTIAIDSISKIVLDIEGYVLEQISSFPYAKVNTEIKHVMDFIERDLATTFNVVLVSHAMYDEKISGYCLVNAGGSYGKKGGILSEVDEAIYLEIKSKKRIIHFRNPKLCARTTISDLPDHVLAENFNLQEHIELLQSKQSKTSEWSL